MRIGRKDHGVGTLGVGDCLADGDGDDRRGDDEGDDGDAGAVADDCNGPGPRSAAKKCDDAPRIE